MILPLAFLLQQAVAYTTPPSGDTTGYWQQHVHYTIAARLDEAAATLHAAGTLAYVNASPDTLRDLYVYQYLNAFRPGSRWSAWDEREHRVRFQRLKDPNYGFERFTSPPRVSFGANSGACATCGDAVAVDYPYAPDSTVAHFRLPQPLAPGDSMLVRFAWDARPSTTPRRQGRRGRSYDFAQWFPKVAVYDRRGWELNPLVPPGEFYGEFGTYDVTLELPNDQVVGATGVVTDGDPGWQRVLQWGTVHPAHLTDPYSAPPPGEVLAMAESLHAEVTPPTADYRAVRFVAQRVHNFAFSLSPDYRYEGGIFIPAHDSTLAFPVADTVPINVLYRRGDEKEWGNGQAIQRTQIALGWLQDIYAPYAWPQFTVLHRIESGGTEFPMMIMNGGASQGLILHEGGHQYSMGQLANNEWRSAWMDEGLTSFQNDWYDHLHATPAMAMPGAHGYRAHALLPADSDATKMFLYQLDLRGRDEPIGRNAAKFHEFGVYNAMVYTRAEMMYWQLRDVLGDSAMRVFMHEYDREWALHHVDEVAMRSVAERACGCLLTWFFDQWVHSTGVVNYALMDARTHHEKAGGWRTDLVVVRRGAWRHPVPVGVRTSDGWTIQRIDELADTQTVSIHTASRPLAARIDPLSQTDDWDARDDEQRPFRPLGIPVLGGRYARYIPERTVVDWPFLNQSREEEVVAAVRPALWYSQWGRTTLGARVRTNYQGWLSRNEYGLAWPLGGNEAQRKPSKRVQAWFRTENPTLPWTGKPVVGFSADAARLDGMTLLGGAQKWNLDEYAMQPGVQRSLSLRGLVLLPYDASELDPFRWAGVSTYEGDASYDWRSADRVNPLAWRVEMGAGGKSATTGRKPKSWYPRLEAEVKKTHTVRDGLMLRGRLFGGYTQGAPVQREIHASALDPVQTFFNSWIRPRDGILSGYNSHFTPLGGAGLRGLAPQVVIPNLVAFNVEADKRIGSKMTRVGPMQLWGSAFADAARPIGSETLHGAAFGAPTSHKIVGDAGVGAWVTGRIYDQPLLLRVDLPLAIRSTNYFIVGATRGGKLSTPIVVSLTDVF